MLPSSFMPGLSAMAGSVLVLVVMVVALEVGVKEEKVL
jgi:hypothetical protein